MDIIFNCPKCDVELAVDASGAGSQINCPECGDSILIPTASTATQTAAPAPPPPPVAHAAAPHVEGGPINAIASSAAAKVEHHFAVPTSNKPVEQLIARANKPLEVAARETDKRVRVKSIRHSDCVEVGHDRFDEVVSQFLGKVGEVNIVTVTPFTYSHIEHAGDKLVNDFGVLIVYKG